MLTINPAKRISPSEALAHPYLDALHDETDEPIYNESMDFAFETDPNVKIEELRSLILEEVNFYNK